MNNKPATRPGFITLDEAVALIKSDTRDNPVVDMDWLIVHKVWLDRNGPAHSFRIPKVRLLKPEEVHRSRTGKMVYEENIGDAWVWIDTAYENELLKKTIADKYAEEMGHEYRELKVRGMSTVADDAEGRGAVQPRPNTPLAKEGAFIGGGETANSNGDFKV